MREKRGRARIDELLSAYLDDELGPGERAWLEARLEADADLRARLEELRQTVALVRGLPQVRAPRNFLLTPSMVGRTEPRRAPRRWLAPALTFATAVSGLLCMVVLVGSLLGGGAALPASAPPVPIAGMPMEATPEEEQVYALAGPPAEQTATAEEEAAVEELSARQWVEPTGEWTPPILGAEAALTGTAQPAQAPPPPRAALATPTGTPTLSLTQPVDRGVTPTPQLFAGAEEKEATTAPPPAQGGRPAPWPLVGGLSLLTLGLAISSLLAWRMRRG